MTLLTCHSLTQLYVPRVPSHDCHRPTFRLACHFPGQVSMTSPQQMGVSATVCDAYWADTWWLQSAQ